MKNPIIYILLKRVNNSLSLKKNFTWTFTGNSIYAASQWFIIIMIVKIEGPNLLGKYVLGLAYCSPIFMLSNLNLRAILATDTKAQYSFIDYFSLRLIFTLTSIIFILFLAYFNNYPLSTKLIIFLVGILKAVEAISDIFYGYFQRIERMDIIAFSQVSKSSAYIIIISLILFLTKNFIISLLILIIFSIFISIVIELPFYFKLNKYSRLPLRVTFYFKKENIHKIYKLFLLAIPLGIVLMIISLNVNIPRYFINHYLGEYELGIFSGITYFIIGGNLIVNALGQSASPRLAYFFNNNKREEFFLLLKKLTIMGIIIGILGIFIAVFYGEILLNLIYTAEYSMYKNLFIVIMISSSFMYISTFLGYSLTAARYLKIQPMLFSIVFAICFISCLILIPRFNLNGAAYVILITNISQMVGSFFIIKKIYKKSFRSVV